MRPEWITEVKTTMFQYYISQTELGERMGVKRAFVSTILSGKRIRPETKERLLNALDELVQERKRENE